MGGKIQGLIEWLSSRLLCFVLRKEKHPFVHSLTQVQFEFLFGAVFLRGLSQLREGLEHYGVEFGGSAIATSTAGAVGQREPPRSPTGSAGLSAAGVHARAFKDRELEVGNWYP